MFYISYRNCFNECKETIYSKLIDIYGYSGSISVILAYGLKDEQLILIDILNLYGSLAIGYICFRSKVWPPVIVEVCWFGIGCYSLIQNILYEETTSTSC